MINLKCIATIFGKADPTCSLVSEFTFLLLKILYKDLYIKKIYKDFCNKIDKNEKIFRKYR